MFTSLKKYITPPPKNSMSPEIRDLIKKVKGQIIQDLCDKYDPPINQVKESNEDKVIRILKHDFEVKHGMTFDEFIETYNRILQEYPEKLI